MKTIRIVLLVLIIIGVGMLATLRWWVPRLVDWIIAREEAKVNAQDMQIVVTGLGQEVGILGVVVTPQEVKEDSRCPADVQCIQAGTVKVRAFLRSGLGTADEVFELNKPITTEVEEVTLVQVEPQNLAGKPIVNRDYVFYFQIRKR
jgi:hypothetical protein